MVWNNSSVRVGDAFGRALLDYLETGEGDEIVERSDGQIFAGDLSHNFAPVSRWPIFERRAMRFVAGRVLDVGCGAGRVALHLQELGHPVLGIDVSPGAVLTSKRRGLKDARVMSVTRITPALGRFDTILLLGNNFGILENPGRARWVLRRFHHLASPGARILAGSRDVGVTDDPLDRRYQRANVRRGRASGQMRFRVRHRDMATPWFDYLMVSMDQMESILMGTGWWLDNHIADGARYVAILRRST
jgi:SAM-dependent methyltransferase